nr:transposase, MuDR, MULE transposase domain protein [Tanacetum cinerariifolium]
MDACSFDLNQLNEEVLRHYPSHSDQVFSIVFVNKYDTRQSFIELNSDENFMDMLNMYEQEKEITIYVSTDKNLDTHNTQQSGQHEVIKEPNVIEEPTGDGDLDHCPSDESYFSHLSTDDDGDVIKISNYDYSNAKKGPTMEVSSNFLNVVAFRRAFNHHVVINEYDYFIKKSDLERFTARCTQQECPWRIHASVKQDDITFEVKNLNETHTCIRSNMGGNRRATQGWIVSVVTDKVRSDGDVSVAELRKWLMKHYSVDIPYHRVFSGKEQAYSDVYGKWDDSFLRMNDFREELNNGNPRSVVKIDFEMIDDKKCFKWKFNGVLAAATGIDGNKAYSVLETKNTSSWTWFLESVKKSIGTPDGLVISSDMQKGLEVAIMQVYPNVEHRECMRHLYSNYKKNITVTFSNQNFELPQIPTLLLSMKDY